MCQDILLWFFFFIHLSLFVFFLNQWYNIMWLIINTNIPKRHKQQEAD